MPVVIKIVSLINGDPSPADNQYLRYYNPSPISAPPGQCDLFTTPELDAAKRYPTLIEARTEWMRVDTRNPTRPDGKPNRPLTAFSVLIETVEDEDEDKE